MNDNNFLWLQKWFLSQCDGDWEHEFGITIQTVDNPGWHVAIDLTGTFVEDESFLEVRENIDDREGILCLVRNNKFEGFCGPCTFLRVLSIFRNWVEEIEKRLDKNE